MPSPARSDPVPLPELPAEFEGSFTDYLRKVQEGATVAAEAATIAADFAVWLSSCWQPSQAVCRCALPAASSPCGDEAVALVRQALADRQDATGEVMVLGEGRGLLLLPVQRIVDDFVAAADAAGGTADLFVEQAYTEAGLFGAPAVQRCRALLQERQEKEGECQKIPERFAAAPQVLLHYGTLLLSAVDAKGMLVDFQRRCLAAAGRGGGSCEADYEVPWRGRDGAGRAVATQVARELRQLCAAAKLPEAEAAPRDLIAVAGQQPSWAVRLRCQWQRQRQRAAPGGPSPGARRSGSKR
eukprot:TRINITY_DN6236_c0_g1_i1.p1 TRINITY_DN6236_c0_g1~~TRINITY_DN6236_c0_g1_i1.p1  ORF type:complete len:333 (+),score=130.43 TRINITY_DN6236_c0_g1_i1:103-999(+)